MADSFTDDPSASDAAVADGMGLIDLADLEALVAWARLTLLCAPVPCPLGGCGSLLCMRCRVTRIVNRFAVD